MFPSIGCKNRMLRLLKLVGYLKMSEASFVKRCFNMAEAGFLRS
nr:MAG TPA: hypothetical protein [Inoviridae sp.]